MEFLSEDLYGGQQVSVSDALNDINQFDINSIQNLQQNLDQLQFLNPGLFGDFNTGFDPSVLSGMPISFEAILGEASSGGLMDTLRILSDPEFQALYGNIASDVIADPEQLQDILNPPRFVVGPGFDDQRIFRDPAEIDPSEQTGSTEDQSEETQQDLEINASLEEARNIINTLINNPEGLSELEEPQGEYTSQFIEQYATNFAASGSGVATVPHPRTGSDLVVLEQGAGVAVDFEEVGAILEAGGNFENILDAIVPYIPGIELPEWFPSAGIIFLPSVGEIISEVSEVVSDIGNVFEDSENAGDIISGIVEVVAGAAAGVGDYVADKLEEIIGAVIGEVSTADAGTILGGVVYGTYGNNIPDWVLDVLRQQGPIYDAVRDAVIDAGGDAMSIPIPVSGEEDDNGDNDIIVNPNESTVDDSTSDLKDSTSDDDEIRIIDDTVKAPGEDDTVTPPSDTVTPGGDEVTTGTDTDTDEVTTGTDTDADEVTTGTTTDTDEVTTGTDTDTDEVTTGTDTDADDIITGDGDDPPPPDILVDEPDIDDDPPPPDILVDEPDEATDWIDDDPPPPDILVDDTVSDGGGNGGGGNGKGNNSFKPFMASVGYTPVQLQQIIAPPKKDYFKELDNLIGRSLFGKMI